MAVINPHTSRATGTVLTAAIYNADHQNHITNANSLNAALGPAGSIAANIGIIVSNGGGVISGRALQPVAGQTVITNPTGVAGDPSIGIANNPALPGIVTFPGSINGPVTFTGSLLGANTLVGCIFDYAGTAAPVGFLMCFGQSLLRASYTALFAVIGVTFGSVDGTHFTLPDLRGRVGAGVDNMGGTSANRLTGASGGIDGDVLGNAGGLEIHTLTIAQLAAHRHGSAGLTVYGGGLVMADATGMTNRDTSATTKVTTDVGSDQPHNNVQPTIALNKIIYAGV